jgi:hypothetical protein
MEAALAIGEATGDLSHTTPYAKAGVASARAALAG